MSLDVPRRPCMGMTALPVMPSLPFISCAGCQGTGRHTRGPWSSRKPRESSHPACPLGPSEGRLGSWPLARSSGLTGGKVLRKLSPHRSSRPGWLGAFEQQGPRETGCPPQHPAFQGFHKPGPRKKSPCTRAQMTPADALPNTHSPMSSQSGSGGVHIHRHTFSSPRERLLLLPGLPWARISVGLAFAPQARLDFRLLRGARGRQGAAAMGGGIAAAGRCPCDAWPGVPAAHHMAEWAWDRPGAVTYWMSQRRGQVAGSSCWRRESWAERAGEKRGLRVRKGA